MLECEVKTESLRCKEIGTPEDSTKLHDISFHFIADSIRSFTADFGTAPTI